MIRLRAALGVAGVSFSAVLYRLAAVSPATAAFYRMAYALLFLGVLVLFWRSETTSAFHNRALAMIAGVVFAVDLILYHNSIRWIGAGLAPVLASTQVLFVALLGWMLHAERPRVTTLWILPFLLMGVAGVSGLGRPDAYGADPLPGTLAGVLTGASYAGFLLLLRHATGKRGRSVTSLLDATVGTALVCLVYGLSFEPDFTLTPSWRSHLWLVVLALLVQVIGWLLITHALPRLPALETSLMILLQPVFALVWAWILFGEALSWLQLGGAAMVIGAIGFLSASGAVEPSGE